MQLTFDHTISDKKTTSKKTTGVSANSGAMACPPSPRPVIKVIIHWICSCWQTKIIIGRKFQTLNHCTTVLCLSPGFFGWLCLQGHDGQVLNVGLWVAVAYNTKFYVGKIIELSSAEEIEIDFLTKKKDGSFRWPKPQDLTTVHKNYIFSHARVQKVGTGFVVINLDYVTKKYQTYHEKYMAQ